MEKRHSVSLKELLEVVAFEGNASIQKWRLMQWFGQTNFTIAVRRSLRERWATLIEDELEWAEIPDLLMAEWNGRILFLRGDSLIKDEE